MNAAVRAPRAPPGPYAIKIELAGFKDVQQQGLRSARSDRRQHTPRGCNLSEKVTDFRDVAARQTASTAQSNRFGTKCRDSRLRGTCRTSSAGPGVIRRTIIEAAGVSRQTASAMVARITVDAAAPKQPKNAVRNYGARTRSRS